MVDYTRGAFEAFEEEDIKGLLKTNLECAKDDLDQVLIMLEELFKAVDINDFESVKEYFIGEDSQAPEYIEKRSQVYKYIATLIRSYAKISNFMFQLKIPKTEQLTIKKQVEEYTKIRTNIELSSGDYINLTKYEPDMKFLIDTYIKANDSQLLSELEGRSFIEILLSDEKHLLDELPSMFDGSESLAAEAIEENIRRVITQNTLSNPHLYQRLSEKLEELIKLRKENAVAYKECLDNFLEYCEDIYSDSSYPASITKLGTRALYDIIKEENFVLALDEFIKKEKPDDWKKDSSGMKIKKFQKKVSNYISNNSDFNYKQISDIFETIVRQNDYN